MRVSDPVDNAIRDARQAIIDVEAGRELSITRMIALLTRLWLGSKLLQLVWLLGL